MDWTTWHFPFPHVRPGSPPPSSLLRTLLLAEGPVTLSVACDPLSSLGWRLKLQRLGAKMIPYLFNLFMSRINCGQESTIPAFGCSCLAFVLTAATSAPTSLVGGSSSWAAATASRTKWFGGKEPASAEDKAVTNHDKSTVGVSSSALAFWVKLI